MMSVFWRGKAGVVGVINNIMTLASVTIDELLAFGEVVFYHDGCQFNGGIREVVSIDVPDELGEYFMDLMEQ